MNNIPNIAKATKLADQLAALLRESQVRMEDAEQGSTASDALSSVRFAADSAEDLRDTLKDLLP